MTGKTLSSIIVSCGNVTCGSLVDESLVIAKGSLTCNDGVWKSRLISGKTVVFKNKALVEGSIIAENDMNPLGYIRWETPGDGFKK